MSIIEKEATELSGHENGFFVEELRNGQAKRQDCDWVVREKQEESMGYYTRAATQAKAMNYPLAFRRGGGSSLGLKGKTPDTRGFNPWVVHGVPKWWGPSCLQAFFQTNNWEVQEESLSLPRTQRQGWLVNLKPAEQAKEAEMAVFECGDHTIKARKWQKLKPDVESKPIRREGRWARPKEEDLARQVLNEETKAT